MVNTLEIDWLARAAYPPDFPADLGTSPRTSSRTGLSVECQNLFQPKRVVGTYVGGVVSQRFWRYLVATSARTSFSPGETETLGVENNRLGELLESTLLLVQPKKTRSAISAIKFNFSLNLSQFADVLGVARPTVYAWLDEESEVRIQPPHQWRIERLAAYAELWWDKANRPFPKELFDLAQGQQLLHLLSSQPLNDLFIRKVIDALARELPPKRKLATVKGVGPVPKAESALTTDELADL
jgi:hypothetical protein